MILQPNGDFTFTLSFPATKTPSTGNTSIRFTSPLVIWRASENRKRIRSDFIEDVARRNKLPLEAFSSFLLHAKIDPRHRADLDSLLDILPLSKKQLGLIGLSAVQTIQYLAEVLTDVNTSHLC